MAARVLLRPAPAAARARADSLIARDPDDFLGRWLSGVLLARDSLVADSALRAAGRSPRKAGPQVEGGTILLVRNQTDSAGAWLARARQAYERSGRLADASRAALWRFRQAWDRGNAAPFLADVAVAESLARKAADPAALADVLILKGGQATRSDNRVARASFQEAYDLLLPLGSSGQLTGAQRGLALTLDRDGDHKGAAHHYAGAFRLAEAQRDTFQAIISLSGLAYAQMGEEDYPGALTTLRRAHAMALASRNPRSVATSQHNLGNVLQELGELPESRDAYLASLRAMEEARLDTDNKPVTMVNLAGVEGMLGEYDAARARLEEALAFSRKRNIHLTSADALLKLARLNREMGDLEEARKLSDEALALCIQSSYKQKLAMVQDERARALHGLGLAQEALEASRAGMTAAREYAPRHVWHLALDEAAALSALGRGGDAIALLDSMLAQPTADSSHVEGVLLLKGDLLLQSGQVTAAIAALERGLGMARSSGGPGRIADAQLTLGRALLESGAADRAVPVLDEGLRWFESVQSAVQASQERSAYQARWHDGYVTLARAYAATARKPQAFATLERSRARELRRLFGRPSSARVPADLARQVNDVESRLTGLQAALFRQYALPSSERSRSLATLERRVDSLRAEWEKLDRRLQREAPDFAREAGLLPAAAASEIQRALRSDQRLLAFMVGRDATLLFDVSRDRLDVHSLALGEEALSRQVGQVKQDLRRGANGPATPELARALLGACRLAERPPRSLVIVPDAALHHVPFEALTVAGSPGAPGRYLLELSEVVYAPSATLWLHPPVGDRRTKPAEVPMLAFGDPTLADSAARAAPASMRGALERIGPLPHARREVRELSARFPGSRVYVAEQATEERFFAEAPLASRVHLAAHAILDEARPEFSGIVLARAGPASQGPAADGLVQVYELMARRFDLDLAVLSACESGGGKLERGEGLNGLARAFRLAGTRELVVSLWKVDDAATATLMGEFYTRLAGGTSPASALRGAKLALLRRAHRSEPMAATEPRGVAALPADERLATPSAWAAFVLLGTRR